MKKKYSGLLSFVFLLTTLGTFAQNPDTATTIDGSVWDGCVIVPKPFTEHVFIPRAKSVAYNMDNRVMPCATFSVNYNGFSAEAETAFQYAVDIWANLIDSPIQITMTAAFEPLATGVLGSAGPTSFSVNQPGFLPSTAYARPLAESIIGAETGTVDPVAGGSVDITASFNSDRSDWYFGTDGNTPPDEIDFVTVVLHEIGHGLGLLGFGRIPTDGMGNPDPDPPVNGELRNSGFVHIWDQFIDGSGSAITSFPDPSSQLLDEFTGGMLTCNSALATAQNGGVTPEMYAPGTFNSGSSYSHWDESTYPDGNPNALMTPFLADGVAIHHPGNMTLGFMQDMGWTLCAGALSNDEFTIEDFTISPNPFESKLTIALGNGALNISSSFDIDILDINGRVIRSSKFESSNGLIEIENLETLSPALYFIKITNASGNSLTKKIIKK